MIRRFWKRWMIATLATCWMPAAALAFSTDPGPVQNVSTLNIFNRSVEVAFDPPSNARGEVKDYYVEWVSSTALIVGNKAVPNETGRTVVQVQPLVPGLEYTINIYPVDAEGLRGSPTVLTRVRALGSYETEIENNTANGTQGFLFLPELDLPNMRPNIEKLSNDLYGGLHFGGNLTSSIFDFAAIANNSQEHWHWIGRQTAESAITTRMKGVMYLADGNIHTLEFDPDEGPLGTRAWYIVLTPAKTDRFRLIPKGADGDDTDTAWPLEQVRVKIQQAQARVSRYQNGVKIQEQTFNWRTNVHFNVRQRLSMDITQKGVTFFADTDYTGELLPIGTFGTDLSGWPQAYAHLVLGQYPDFENSRAGTNAFGAVIQQDAYGFMHWGNVAFTNSASHPTPSEVSYYKDSDLAVRTITRVDGTQPFPITTDAEGPDILSRELVFTDGSNYPACDAPGDAVLKALSSPSTQVMINGSALASQTLAQLQAEAPAYRYVIPGGLLHAGVNTVSIVQGANAVRMPIYAPHIDFEYPGNSPSLASYTPPPVSHVVDMMPADSMLKGWSLPSVDFPVPLQSSGTLILNYRVDASHSMENAGLIVPVTSMTATLDGNSYWVHSSTDVGTMFSSGTITLDTTKYPDGYHNDVLYAYTTGGATGFENGSDTSGGNMDYQMNRRLLIYNGPQVTQAPTISNLVVRDYAGNDPNAISTTTLTLDGTEIVQSGHLFDMTFNVQTPAFLRDVQLLFDMGNGTWTAVGEHTGGSVGRVDGHFDPGVSTMTAAGSLNNFTLDWTYTVDAVREHPFVFTDPDGPWIHYKLVATNVSGLTGEYTFRYKLHDPTMSLFTNVPIPSTVTVSAAMNIPITLQNIGTTSWPGDGSFSIGPFSEDEPLLVPMAGIPITSPVSPGGSITLNITGMPLRPTKNEAMNLVLRDAKGDELFMSTTTVVTVTTGNDATFVAQSSVPVYMDPNTTQTVTITMKNTGVTTWTKAAGYALIPVDPDYNLSWDVPRVQLDDGDSIAPGQQKTFTFTITSPGFPQVYAFQWQMGQQTRYAELFGQKSTVVSMQVGHIPNILIFLSQPTDQWVRPGQQATLWATVKAYPTPATFQWMRKDPPTAANPSPVFVNISSATGSSYTTPPLSVADDSATYVLVASTGTAPGSSITSVEAVVRVSSGAPTVAPLPATYQVTIANAVAGTGGQYLPHTLKVTVTKTAGAPADSLALDMGYGNNPLSIYNFGLDIVNAGTQSFDLTGKVTHHQSVNFSANIVYSDGTTAINYLPDLYTVLLNPPPPPLLPFPITVDARTKIPMAQDFADPAIAKVQLGFTRNMLGAAAPSSGSPAFTPAASSALSATASTFDFGPLNLQRGPWTVQGVATDWVGNTSAASFADFNVVGDNLAGAIVYPNPYDVRIDPDKPIKFGNLTAQANVKIFTVSGHFVRSLDAQGGIATWDKTNSAGQNVASGIYVYLITNDQGDRARGTLTLIR